MEISILSIYDIYTPLAAHFLTTRLASSSQRRRPSAHTVSSHHSCCSGTHQPKTQTYPSVMVSHRHSRRGQLSADVYTTNPPFAAIIPPSIHPHNTPQPTPPHPRPPPPRPPPPIVRHLAGHPHPARPPARPLTPRHPTRFCCLERACCSCVTNVH